MRSLVLARSCSLPRNRLLAFCLNSELSFWLAVFLHLLARRQSSHTTRTHVRRGPTILQPSLRLLRLPQRCARRFCSWFPSYSQGRSTSWRFPRNSSAYWLKPFAADRNFHPDAFLEECLKQFPTRLERRQQFRE